jgi:hypothetical protein
VDPDPEHCFVPTYFLTFGLHGSVSLALSNNCLIPLFQLEDVSRSKQELEDRHLKLAREKVELATQLQENEEELQVSSISTPIN